MTIYLPELDAADPWRFPSPHQALKNPDGLLAMGGDLSSERLIAAYHRGIFPWFSDADPYLWWSPSRRAVFVPSRFHASRSLKRYGRQQRFSLSVNRCFAEVIQHCALLRGADQVWITKEMRSAYTELNTLGHAHSVEIWRDDRLIGGMYGVSVGQVFCAESMFSLEKNASKLLLWQFCSYFASQGGQLIECQMLTPHLASLGAIEITREQYLAKLNQYACQTINKNSFHPAFFITNQSL